MWKNRYKGEEEFMEIKNVILEQELKNIILEKEGKLAIVTINRPKEIGRASCRERV